MKIASTVFRCFTVKSFKKIVAACMAFVLLYTTLAVPLAEANIWNQRKKASQEISARKPGEYAQLAQLPSGMLSELTGPHEITPSLGQVQNTSLFNALKKQNLEPVQLKGLPNALASLPYNSGEIQSFHLSSNRAAPFILLIQDAHEIETAQRNISETLEHMAENQTEPLLVGIEGAVGGFDVDQYRDIPNKEAKEEFLSYLLKDSFIQGAEHYAMTGDKKPELWGVEDEALYVANVQAYRDGLKLAPARDKMLGELEASVAKEKSKISDAGAQMAARQISKYERRDLSLSEFLTFAQEQYPSHAERYPEIVRYRKLFSEEKSLDFKAVEQERTKLIYELSRKADAQSLKGLVQMSVAYRLGKVGYGTYHDFLSRALAANDVSLKNYPKFARYVRYVLDSEKISPENLLAETESLVQRLCDSLFTSPEAKKAVRKGRQTELARKLANQELTPADWEKYQAQKSEIGDLLPGAEWKALLTAYEGFYQVSHARNEAMVRNLEAKLKTQGSAQTAVLIAGGFHTPGLTQEMKAKDFSYAVFRPKIGKINGRGTDYLHVFAMDRTPLEKTLLGEKLYLKAPSASAIQQFSAVGNTAQGIVTNLSRGVLPVIAHEKGSTLDEARAINEAMGGNGMMELEEGVYHSDIFDVAEAREGVSPAPGVQTIRTGARTLWVSRNSTFRAKAAAIVKKLPIKTLSVAASASLIAVLVPALAPAGAQAFDAAQSLLRMLPDFRTAAFLTAAVAAILIFSRRTPPSRDNNFRTRITQGSAAAVAAIIGIGAQTGAALAAPANLAQAPIAPWLLFIEQLLIFLRIDIFHPVSTLILIGLLGLTRVLAGKKNFPKHFINYTAAIAGAQYAGNGFVQIEQLLLFSLIITVVWSVINAAGNGSFLVESSDDKNAEQEAVPDSTGGDAAETEQETATPSTGRDIAELKLMKRIETILRNSEYRITTIEQLEALTDQQLDGINGIGDVYVRRIRIAQHGSDSIYRLDLPLRAITILSEGGSIRTVQVLAQTDNETLLKIPGINGLALFSIRQAQSAPRWRQGSDRAAGESSLMEDLVNRITRDNVYDIETALTEFNWAIEADRNWRIEVLKKIAEFDHPSIDRILVREHDENPDHVVRIHAFLLRLARSTLKKQDLVAVKNQEILARAGLDNPATLLALPDPRMTLNGLDGLEQQLRDSLIDQIVDAQAAQKEAVKAPRKNGPMHAAAVGIVGAGTALLMSVKPTHAATNDLLADPYWVEWLSVYFSDGLNVFVVFSFLFVMTVFIVAPAVSAVFRSAALSRAVDRLRELHYRTNLSRRHMLAGATALGAFAAFAAAFGMYNQQSRKALEAANREEQSRLLDQLGAILNQEIRAMEQTSDPFLKAFQAVRDFVNPEGREQGDHSKEVAVTTTRMIGVDTSGKNAVVVFATDFLKAFAASEAGSLEREVLMAQIAGAGAILVDFNATPKYYEETARLRSQMSRDMTEKRNVTDVQIRQVTARVLEPLAIDNHVQFEYLRHKGVSAERLTQAEPPAFLKDLYGKLAIFLAQINRGANYEMELRVGTFISEQGNPQMQSIVQANYLLAEANGTAVRGADGKLGITLQSILYVTDPQYIGREPWEGRERTLRNLNRTVQLPFLRGASAGAAVGTALSAALALFGFASTGVHAQEEGVTGQSAGFGALQAVVDFAQNEPLFSVLAILSAMLAVKAISDGGKYLPKWSGAVLGLAGISAYGQWMPVESAILMSFILLGAPYLPRLLSRALNSNLFLTVAGGSIASLAVGTFVYFNPIASAYLATAVVTVTALVVLGRKLGAWSEIRNAEKKIVNATAYFGRSEISARQLSAVLVSIYDREAGYIQIQTTVTALKNIAGKRPDIIETLKRREIRQELYRAFFIGEFSEQMRVLAILERIEDNPANLLALKGADKANENVSKRIDQAVAARTGNSSWKAETWLLEKIREENESQARKRLEENRLEEMRRERERYRRPTADRPKNDGGSRSDSSRPAKRSDDDSGGSSSTGLRGLMEGNFPSTDNRWDSWGIVGAFFAATLALLSTITPTEASPLVSGDLSRDIDSFANLANVMAVETPLFGLFLAILPFLAIGTIPAGVLAMGVMVAPTVKRILPNLIPSEITQLDFRPVYAAVEQDGGVIPPVSRIELEPDQRIIRAVTERINANFMGAATLLYPQGDARPVSMGELREFSREIASANLKLRSDEDIARLTAAYGAYLIAEEMARTQLQDSGNFNAGRFEARYAQLAAYAVKTLGDDAAQAFAETIKKEMPALHRAYTGKRWNEASRQAYEKVFDETLRLNPPPIIQEGTHLAEITGEQATSTDYLASIGRQVSVDDEGNGIEQILVTDRWEELIETIRAHGNKGSNPGLVALMEGLNSGRVKILSRLTLEESGVITDGVIQANLLMNFLVQEMMLRDPQAAKNPVWITTVNPNGWDVSGLSNQAIVNFILWTVQGVSWTAPAAQARELFDAIRTLEIQA